MSPRAKPPCKHKVEQGEWLASIAASYGFKDWEMVWNAGENDALRKRRKLPEQLLPGDQVFIPARRQKTEKCATGAAHAFVIDLGQTTLKLKLKDAFDEPIANTEYELRYAAPSGDGAIAGTTDGSGQLEATLPMGAHDALLRFPSLDQSVALQTGHMDPDRDGDEPVRSGMLTRLANLGYPVAEGASADEERIAVQTFQREYMDRGDDKATGELDAETCQSIVSEHGC